MPGHEVETLRRWARGEFHALGTDEQGRDPVDELAAEMLTSPESSWRAFQTVFAGANRSVLKNLAEPFEALLHVGGEALWDEVAIESRHDRKIANAFWDAVYFLQLPQEAYKRLGQQMTVEAFVRHEPRIPSEPGQPRPDEWEDSWSGSVLFYLTQQDPEEAWAVCLELLAGSDDPEWVATIGAFIVEDLLQDHGDAFIDRIEAEAAQNEGLRRALPVARWVIPEHLMARVKTASGRHWNEKL